MSDETARAPRSVKRLLATLGLAVAVTPTQGCVPIGNPPPPPIDAGSDAEADEDAPTDRDEG